MYTWMEGWGEVGGYLLLSFLLSIFLGLYAINILFMYNTCTARIYYTCIIHVLHVYIIHVYIIHVYLLLDRSRLPKMLAFI